MLFNLLQHQFMKSLLFLAVAGLAAIGAYSQPPKGKKTEEKAPTQKEMQAMLKEMQQGMDEMSEEDKKEMEKLGIKMPDMKSLQKTVAGVTDAQLKKAHDDENRIVPLKDANRINTALAVKLSKAEMGSYIAKTQQSVSSKIPTNDKARANEVMQQVSKQKSSLANTAVGLWIEGKPAVALYLMGEACKADLSNTNNLNNYASFLTMCGAEQLAIPILNNLNTLYPKNSNILNNLAQAWLGLGDIDRAGKYADSTLRIAAFHPQANMAKSLIEESKGNIPKAIEAAKKSISKAYSMEKENRLKKLGYDLKSDDLNWNRPMPQDALGLSKFTWPEFPMTVDQNKYLETAWHDFKALCQQQIEELLIKQEKLEEAMIAAQEARTQQALHAMQNGRGFNILPGYAPKAIKKLHYLVDEIYGENNFVFSRALEPVVKALADAAKYEEIYNQQQLEINKKYEDQFGEGRPNPFEAVCNDENGIRSQFLASANGGLQKAYTNYLNYVRRKTGDMLYYMQYTTWPDQFELAKVNAQIAWLRQMKDQRVFFKDKSSWCQKTAVKVEPAQLQLFDDVHCNYVSTLNMGIYKITAACSNLIAEFNFGGVEINLKDNVETGRHSGSAKVGISKGIDIPGGLEVEGSLAGLVEWDNSGITDVGAIAGVDVNVIGQTIAGADVKITVNTGVSTSGKGLLEGLK